MIVTKERKLHENKVESIHCVAYDVYVLRFRREFDFIAGQVVAIDLEPDGQPRLYSIASGEKDEYMEILFDEKHDGKLTPALSRLKPGDSIYVSEPFGTFNCSTDKAWWIAAGTGVAPFVSMARSGLAANKTLIHGGRFDENFYFAPILEKELKNNYVRCCSQQLETQNYKGRLTEWLRNRHSFACDITYYLCGSAEMVVQIRDILIARGVPYHNIISETYF